MKITRKTFLTLSLALLTTFSVVSVPCYAAPVPAVAKAGSKKVWQVAKKILKDYGVDIAIYVYNKTVKDD